MESDKKFSRADLVSFGEYIASDERKKKFKGTKTQIPLNDRLKSVHHADIENWLDKCK